MGRPPAPADKRCRGLSYFFRQGKSVARYSRSEGGEGGGGGARRAAVLMGREQQEVTWRWRDENPRRCFTAPLLSAWD